MILPILVLPLDGPPKHIFCCVVFTTRERRFGRVPKILLGFCFFAASVLSENAPPFYRTDPYFVRY